MDWLFTVLIGTICFIAGVIVDRILTKNIRGLHIGINLGGLILFLLGIVVGYMLSPYMGGFVGALGGLLTFFVILLLIIVIGILLLILRMMLKARKMLKKSGYSIYQHNNR